jgi:hypothetical protein
VAVERVDDGRRHDRDDRRRDDRHDDLRGLAEEPEEADEEEQEADEEPRRTAEVAQPRRREPNIVESR